MVMGTINTKNAKLGRPSVPNWWRTTGAYTEYDSFTASDGTAWDVTKWTVSGSGASSDINTNRGRIYGYQTSGNGTIDRTQTSNAIPAGASVYFEILLGATTSYRSGSSAWSAGFNGVTYLSNPSHSAGSGTASATTTNTQSLRAEYVGNGYYDIYVNGNYSTQISAPTGITAFAGMTTTYSSGDNPTSYGATIYVDNVRYR